MKKIVFCGFGKLGLKSLEELISNGYNVEYIMTHKEHEKDSVDTYAIKNNIPYTYKDARKNEDELLKIIIEIHPLYLVSINYRYILPKKIFEVPKYAINIHGSLLPKYRGRTPHVWSIINGENVSGITSHIIEETVDSGDIIEQIMVKIEKSDTGYTLLQKYQDLYPSLLLKSLVYLEEGRALQQQSNDDASYYGVRTPNMGYIDFYKSSLDVINFVRAQTYPYPGSYYYLSDGRKIIIYKIIVDETVDIERSIGIINKIDDNYYVKCKDSNLRILEYRIIT